MPVNYLEGLAEYWRTGYDWRAHEARLNEFPQFMTEIDGQRVHFLHVRSPEPGALPLMLIHGWPGSFVEFIDLVGPLTDPVSHGGDAADAFHVVVPSVPGHGFSMPLSETVGPTARIAAAFTELMARLGYDRYGVQGGDIGASRPRSWAGSTPSTSSECMSTPWSLSLLRTRLSLEGLTDAEQERLARLQHFQQEMMGYAQIQGTRPQTVAYGLSDSPAGQLAWIVEKFKEWTDPLPFPRERCRPRSHAQPISASTGSPTASGSSANLYYETFHDPSLFAPQERGTVPTGVAVFTTQDVAIRRFAEREHNIVHWSEFDRGGHFAAWKRRTSLQATFVRSSVGCARSVPPRYRISKSTSTKGCFVVNNTTIHHFALTFRRPTSMTCETGWTVPAGLPRSPAWAGAAACP